MVYCAPNPATSLVEVLVHIEIDSEDLPDPLPYLEIEAPDRTSVGTLEVNALGRNWQRNLEATRHAGDRMAARRPDRSLAGPVGNRAGDVECTDQSPAYGQRTHPGCTRSHAAR